MVLAITAHKKKQPVMFHLLDLLYTERSPGLSIKKKKIIGFANQQPIHSSVHGKIYQLFYEPWENFRTTLINWKHSGQLQITVPSYMITMWYSKLERQLC